MLSSISEGKIEIFLGEGSITVGSVEEADKLRDLLGEYIYSIEYESYGGLNDTVSKMCINKNS